MARKAANHAETPQNGHKNGQTGPTHVENAAQLPHFSLGDVPDDQIRNIFDKMQEIIHNRDWTRAKSIDTLFNKRRNIEKECGYPEWGAEDIQQYQKLYDREAVARRVVEVMPKECFQVLPRIFESEDIKVTTPFERSLSAFNKALGGGSNNHYVDDVGSALVEKFYELDVKCGIGEFGIILFGLDDVRSPEDLAEPVQGFIDTFTEPVSAGRRVLFMRTFSASDVEVTERESNPTSPRYGAPNLYNINFEQGSYKVHWTRVLHVDAESEAPRMQAVLNRLLDLRKVYSCSAEMYWLSAFMGIFFKVQDKALELAHGKPLIDVAEMRNQIENFFNSLQRALQLTGLEPVPMYTNQLVDPQGQVQVLMEAICVEVGIPKRIFTGSERGELASSQDDKKWNERVKHRQDTFLTPRIIVPCVNRLIQYGALQPPGRKGFRVEWPDMTAQTELEHADIVFKVTQAMSGYQKAGVFKLIPEFEFLTLVVGLSEKEALNVVAKAKLRTAEADTKQREDEERISKLGGKLPKPKLKLPEGELENRENKESPELSTEPKNALQKLPTPSQDLESPRRERSRGRLMKRLVKAFEALSVKNQEPQIPSMPARFDHMGVVADSLTLKVEHMEMVVNPHMVVQPTINNTFAPQNVFEPSLILPEMSITVSATAPVVHNNIQPTPYEITNNIEAPVIEGLKVIAEVNLPERKPRKVVVEGPSGTITATEE